MYIEYVLYFIDLLHGLNELTAVIFIISILVFMGLFMTLGLLDPNNKPEQGRIFFIKKSIKTSFLVMIIAGIFSALIPSKSTMYAMALIRYSKQSEIPQMAIKAIEVKLDEIIKQELVKKQK